MSVNSKQPPTMISRHPAAGPVISQLTGDDSFPFLQAQEMTGPTTCLDESDVKTTAIVSSSQCSVRDLCRVDVRRLGSPQAARLIVKRRGAVSPSPACLQANVRNFFLNTAYHRLNCSEGGVYAPAIFFKSLLISFGGFGIFFNAVTGISILKLTLASPTFDAKLPPIRGTHVIRIPDSLCVSGSMFQYIE